MRLTRKHKTLWAAPLLLCLGCVAFTFPDPIPPAESVLEGTWKVVTADQTDLTAQFWVFDQLGRLVEIQYVIGNATIKDTDPVADSSLDGDHLIVQIGGNNTNSKFDGTLNAEQTEATGALTLNWSFVNTVVTIDQGTATLTKQ